MHSPHCLKIARRMHLLLQREIGRGVDLQRMLRDPLYARDVLLVCQALPRTELPELAEFYRRAAACPDEAELAAAKRRKGTGFNSSRLLHSLFGPPAGPKAQAAPMSPPLRLGSRPAPAH